MKQPNSEQETSQWKSEDRRLVEPKVPYIRDNLFWVTKFTKAEIFLNVTSS